MLHTTLKLAQDNYVKLAGEHPNQQGVCQSHRGLAIYIKKYLKAKKKNYGSYSNISPRKNIPNLQKIL